MFKRVVEDHHFAGLPPPPFVGNANAAPANAGRGGVGRIVVVVVVVASIDAAVVRLAATCASLSASATTTATAFAATTPVVTTVVADIATSAGRSVVHGQSDSRFGPAHSLPSRFQ